MAATWSIIDQKRMRSPVSGAYSGVRWTEGFFLQAPGRRLLRGGLWIIRNTWSRHLAHPSHRGRQVQLWLTVPHLGWWGVKVQGLFRIATAVARRCAAVRSLMVPFPLASTCSRAWVLRFDRPTDSRCLRPGRVRVRRVQQSRRMPISKTRSRGMTRVIAPPSTGTPLSQL